MQLLLRLHYRWIPETLTGQVILLVKTLIIRLHLIYFSRSLNLIFTLGPTEVPIGQDFGNKISGKIKGETIVETASKMDLTDKWSKSDYPWNIKPSCKANRVPSNIFIQDKDAEINPSEFIYLMAKTYLDITEHGKLSEVDFMSSSCLTYYTFKLAEKQLKEVRKKQKIGNKMSISHIEVKIIGILFCFFYSFT